MKKQILRGIAVLMLFLQTDGVFGENLTTEKVVEGNSDPYIAKYLPEMWNALKRANEDEYLLYLKKLKSASEEFEKSITKTILKYLNATKPIAYVKVSEFSNDSCEYVIIREHVEILHVASNKGFRCLKQYKIGISNTYVDAPKLEKEEQEVVDKTFKECLEDFITKANDDFEQLSSSVSLCANGPDDGNDNTTTATDSTATVDDSTIDSSIVVPNDASTTTTTTTTSTTGTTTTTTDTTNTDTDVNSTDTTTDTDTDVNSTDTTTDTDTDVNSTDTITNTDGNSTDTTSDSDGHSNDTTTDTDGNSADVATESL